ncbi:MAG: Txe/YoeB family addiction module toxin [Bacteroidaceae bacterium]|nr:Txe/YoeB family addiction module toxin [Bacteroidaceae bacterium]
MYKLEYTDEAKLHMQRLKHDEPKAFQKMSNMLLELMKHPTTGTGHPEPLKGEPQGRWSRRITKKHRLVYRIYNDEVLVLILSSYGHYEDK